MILFYHRRPFKTLFTEKVSHALILTKKELFFTKDTNIITPSNQLVKNSSQLVNISLYIPLASSNTLGGDSFFESAITL